MEMRPERMTKAHNSGDLAELVCSNSFKSDLLPSAPAILKRELRALGSLILEAADFASVPAGSALAVNRTLFSEFITGKIEGEELIEVVRGEATNLTTHSPTIIASGPLTSESLTEALREIAGEHRLYFYDAISPVISEESIESPPVYGASRYGKGGDEDYLNIPLNHQEYERLVDQLLEAELYPLHDFEQSLFYEGCMPIEEIARRGRRTLAFGPLKPVGLPDPRTGKIPHAVIQLRKENREGTAYNLVGCQTRMKQGEQRRILRELPGLAHAEFLRYGSLHRNTYLSSPRLLGGQLELKEAPPVRLAGQITGVEGYLESTATGFAAGLAAWRELSGLSPLDWPPETAIGALLRYLRDSDPDHFQPTNINFGLFPRLPGKKRRKRERNEAVAARAEEALKSVLNEALPR